MPDPEVNDETTPSWHRLHLWQIQPVRDVAVVILALALLQLGWVLRSVTVPMLVALGLAYLVEPLVRWCGNRHRALKRVRVVALLLSVLLALLVIVGGLVTALAVPQAKGLIENAPAYVERLIGFAASERMPAPIREVAERLRGEVVPATPVANPAFTDEQSLEQVVQREVERQLARQQADNGGESSLYGHLARGGVQVARWAAAVVGGAVQLAFSLFLIGFFFVVFSTSFPVLQRDLRSWLPASQRPRILDLLGQMDRVVSAFVRGRLLISVILGSVFAIGWSLCGVPHGIVLGLAVGILTLAPYVSMVGVPLAWGLLAVRVLGPEASSSFYVGEGVDGELAVSWWLVLLLPALVYAVAQVMDDYLLTPLIQGRATNLSPAAIMAAVLAGGALYGFYGMLLAVPAAACLRILLGEVWLPRVRRWLQGESSDPLPLDG